MKFEIDELINEMLDKLPVEIWNDPNHTFLDPSAGGGQFLKEIEKRLVMHGYSIDNIQSRVFGFFDSMLEMNYAKNKHSLHSQLFIADIDTIDNLVSKELNNMKFDVVIGNPPFQKSGTSKHMLYPHFINKSFDIINNDGVVALISPKDAINMIFGGSASQVSFKHKVNNIFIAIGTPKRFFDIGSSFSYFISIKNENQKNTTFECYDNDGNIVTTELNYNIPFIPEYINPNILNIIHKVFNSGDNNFNRNVKRCSNNSGNKDVTAVITIKNDSPVFEDWKIKDNYSVDHCLIISRQRPWKYIKIDNQNIVNGTSNNYTIPALDVDENNSNEFILLESKIIKFLWSIFKSNGSYIDPLYHIVKFLIKPNRNITNDQELYEYFNLTQEEIDYIEANV